MPEERNPQQDDLGSYHIESSYIPPARPTDRVDVFRAWWKRQPQGAKIVVVVFGIGILSILAQIPVRMTESARLATPITPAVQEYLDMLNSDRLKVIVLDNLVERAEIAAPKRLLRVHVNEGYWREYTAAENSDKVRLGKSLYVSMLAGIYIGRLKMDDVPEPQKVWVEFYIGGQRVAEFMPEGEGRIEVY